MSKDNILYVHRQKYEIRISQTGQDMSNVTINVQVQSWNQNFGQHFSLTRVKNEVQQRVPLAICSRIGIVKIFYF
jgi:hypothetical protein